MLMMFAYRIFVTLALSSLENFRRQRDNNPKRGGHAEIYREEVGGNGGNDG